MPTTAELSTSDSHHATSSPATEPAGSPPSPFKRIIDRYNRMALYDPPVLEAVRKTCYTTKASILSNAVTKTLLTDTQYHEHTFEILVEFTKCSELIGEDHGRYDICTIPVTMCVDEGSYEEFKSEMARIFEEDIGLGPFKRLDVKWKDRKDSSSGRKSYCFDKDTAERLKLLKARESDCRLTVDWYVDQGFSVSKFFSPPEEN